MMWQISLGLSFHLCGQQQCACLGFSRANASCKTFTYLPSDADNKRRPTRISIRKQSSISMSAPSCNCWNTIFRLKTSSYIHTHHQSSIIIRKFSTILVAPSYLPAHRWSILFRQSWAHGEPSAFRSSTIASIESPCMYVSVNQDAPSLLFYVLLQATFILSFVYLKAFVDPTHQGHKLREALGMVDGAAPGRQERLLVCM